MAKFGFRADSLGQQATLSKGLLSSRKRREQVGDTDLLFHVAVKALDTTHFPESVRSDMADESAIQLKHVLDYVFSHSHQQIIIPSLADLKFSDDAGSASSASWRSPGTAIELTTVLDHETDNGNYSFLDKMVLSIHDIYDEIQYQTPIDQPYATPLLCRDFFHSWF